MKIVVTGSSGRLGKVVIRQLLALGHEIVAVDKNPSTDSSQPSTHVLNLTDYAAFRPLVEGADVICHLGNAPWISRKTDPVDGFTANVTGNYMVLEAALDARVRKIVFASSIQAYGMMASNHDEPKLYSSPVYLPVDEDHPLLPVQPYPLSKVIGESTCAAYTRRDPAMQAVSLRFTAIMQPGGSAWWRNHSSEKGNWLPASLGTYVHAEDAARSVRLAFELDRPGHTALNVVAQDALCPWTPEDIIASYGSVPEFRSKLDGSQALISPKRAKEILGFTAEFSPEGTKLSES